MTSKKGTTSAQATDVVSPWARRSSLQDTRAAIRVVPTLSAMVEGASYRPSATWNRHAAGHADTRLPLGPKGIPRAAPSFGHTATSGESGSGPVTVSVAGVLFKSPGNPSFDPSLGTTGRRRVSPGFVPSWPASSAGAACEPPAAQRQKRACVAGGSQVQEAGQDGTKLGSG